MLITDGVIRSNRSSLRNQAPVLFNFHSSQYHGVNTVALREAPLRKLQPPNSYWGVERAMFKMLALYDKNPWRNKWSKFTTFDLILQRPHSAMACITTTAKLYCLQKLKKTKTPIHDKYLHI